MAALPRHAPRHFELVSIRYAPIVCRVGRVFGCWGNMADFYEVWLCRGGVLTKLNAMLEAREAARDQELKAATDIGRVYRGKVCTTV